MEESYSQREHNMSERWLMFWERVGGPTLIVVLLLLGLYHLGKPAVTAFIKYIEIQSSNMERQTHILRGVAEDMQATRRLLEIDKAERKAEMLKEIKGKLSDLEKKLDSKGE